MNKKFIIIGALLIGTVALLVTVFIFSSIKSSTDVKKEVSSKGYEYESIKIAEVYPEHGSFNQDGSEFRYYDFMDNKLKSYSIREKKNVWQSANLEKNFKRVIWSPFSREAIIVLPPGEEDGEDLEEYRLIKKDGLYGNTWSDVADLGWWDAETVFALKNNNAGSAVTLQIKNSGKDTETILTKEDVFSKIFVSPDKKQILLSAGIIGGEEYSLFSNLSTKQERRIDFLINAASWSQDSNMIAVFTERDADYLANIFNTNSMEKASAEFAIDLPEKMAWKSRNQIFRAESVLKGSGGEKKDNLQEVKLGNIATKKLLLESKENLSIEYLTYINDKLYFLAGDRIIIFNLKGSNE
jgi:hypothetical protein